MPDPVALYKDGLTQRQISELLGISQATVSRRLAEAGVPTRTGSTAAPYGTQWKCGKYVVEKVDPADPVLAPMAHQDGRVLSHRAAMARTLGRPLHSHEEVHHLNGDGHDNRPENLELWVKSHPRGQRIEDLQAFARWIIDTYGSGA